MAHRAAYQNVYYKSTFVVDRQYSEIRISALFVPLILFRQFIDNAHALHGKKFVSLKRINAGVKVGHRACPL